jgi:hypothetical protein
MYDFNMNMLSYIRPVIRYLMHPRPRPRPHPRIRFQLLSADVKTETDR